MDILKDVEKLHQASEPVNESEKQEIINSLINSIPENALGLAAPQIGIFKRAFLANFSFDKLVFINPEVISTSSEQISSVEGCLSIEGGNCINRFTRIDIRGEAIRCPNENLGIVQLRLSGLDANIAQHELDHLNGVLISDRPRVKNPQEKIQERYQKRMRRVVLNRKAKQALQLKQQQKSQAPKKLSKQEIEKNKKRRYKERRRERRKIAILEFNKAVQDGLVKTENETDNQTKQELNE